MRTEETKKLILEELEEDWKEFLDKKGFKRRYPLLIKHNEGFSIEYEPEETYHGTDNTLSDLIKESEIGFNLIEHKVVQEWIKESYSGKVFKRTVLEKMLKNSYPEERSNLLNEYEDISSQIKHLPAKDIRKQELIYFFNEPEEQIEELMNNFYTHTTLEHKKIGNFSTRYTIDSEEYLSKVDIPEPNLFDEFPLMYKAIREYQPPTFLSTKTGEVYSLENIKSVRVDDIIIQNKEGSLAAVIERNGLDETIDCSLQLFPIHISRKDLTVVLGMMQGYQIVDSKKQRVLAAKKDEIWVLKDYDRPNTIIIQA